MEAILIMPETLREKLEELALAGYPHESCGLLLGENADGECRVKRVTRARNISTERAADRYELDPDDFAAADREARAAGLDIVGVWHTHPDHPAQPSETDRAAAWSGWAYVIVSVSSDGIRELRSWRLKSGQFEEESIQPCQP